MNVVNDIMIANRNKGWLRINGNEKTFGYVFQQAYQIKEEIRKKLDMKNKNYILFVDPNDIELSINLLIAATQSEGISICFDIEKRLEEESIYLNNKRLKYKELGKNEEQKKGIVITKTSGTTGEPKYILYSLQNKIDRARQMKSILNIDSTDKMLLTTKLNHSLGLRILFTSLMSKCKLEIPDNMSSEGIKNAIIEKRPTKLIVVSLILANALEELKNCRKAFKAIMLSSSSASRELKNSLFDMGIQTFEMYGASEVGTITVKKVTKEGIKSLGKTLKDTELIVNANTSEIQVRTKNICLGYLNKDLRIFKVFNKDEYFTTGDIGQLDSSGELEFLGRVDSEFKSGGIKINPYSIEQKIIKANLKNVIDCVCIGVDDCKLEKVVAINLIIKEGLSNEEIKKIKLSILGVVEKHEMPRYLKLSDEVCRLENGKLDRKKLEKDMVIYVDSLR